MFLEFKVLTLFNFDNVCYNKLNNKIFTFKIFYTQNVLHSKCFIVNMFYTQYILHSICFIVNMFYNKKIKKQSIINYGIISLSLAKSVRLCTSI